MENRRERTHAEGSVFRVSPIRVTDETIASEMGSGVCRFPFASLPDLSLQLLDVCSQGGVIVRRLTQT